MRSPIPPQYKTECPDCGQTIDERGLGSHKDSEPCRIEQHKQIREGENLVQLSFIGGSQAMIDYLEEKNYPYKQLLNKNGTEHCYTTPEAQGAVRANFLRNPQRHGERAELVKQLQGEHILCNGEGNQTLSRRYNNHGGLFIIKNTQELDLTRKRVIYVETWAHKYKAIAFTTKGRRIGSAYPLEELEKDDNLDINSADIVSAII